MPDLIGVLGGTFDPVHKQHIAIARAAKEQFGLAEVRFMPTFQPAHRQQPIASFADRVAMLELALADEPNFIVDTREQYCSRPSHLANSLMSLKSSALGEHLVFILGSDAFESFADWYRPDLITALSHILVYERPGHPIDDTLKQQKLPKQLKRAPAGQVSVIEGELCDLSATQIRKDLSELEKAVTLPDLNTNVRQYILDNKLYLYGD